MLNQGLSKVISNNSLEFFDAPNLIALIRFIIQNFQLTLHFDLKIFELQNPCIVTLVYLFLCFYKIFEFISERSTNLDRFLLAQVNFVL